MPPQRTASLPREASIFTAELYALKMSLNVVRERQESRSIIFTDSKSLIQALVSNKNVNASAEQIKYDIHKFRKGGKTVELSWIQGHVGIVGNEKSKPPCKAWVNEKARIDFTTIYQSIQYNGL